jgi:uncharacterized protein involved in outer membrane biogenesis
LVIKAKKMRRKWLLISLSAVILLPILLVVAVLVFISVSDLTQHRDVIAKQASNILGRQLTLAGELELNLGGTTSFVVSDIRLANAAWASEADLLAVKRFEAEIEIMPLLRGDIQIPRLHVKGVDASLETDADGQGNWVLADADAPAPASEDTGTPAGLKLPWVGDLSISDVEIAYQDASSGQKVTATLDRANTQWDEPTAPLVIDVAGQVNEHPVTVNGELVLPTVLEMDELDLPVELHASVLGLEAEAQGSIKGSARAPAVDLSLVAKADSLKPMREVFGDVVPEVKSVELKMELQGDQGQPLSAKFNATAGKARLNADLKLRREPPRPKLTGAVAINDVDVARMWASLLAQEPDTQASKKTPTESTSAPERFDQPIDLAWAGILDANVVVSMERINLPQMRIKTLHSRLIIDERTVTIDESEIVTDAGSANTKLTVDARKKQAAVALDLTTSEIKLGKLEPLAKNERFKHGHVSTDIALSGAGETIAALVESLEGSVQLDYANKQTKEELTLNLAHQPKQKGIDRARVTVSADGKMDNQAIKLRGNLIPPEGMLKMAKPYTVDLALEAFGITGKVSGTAAAATSLEGLDLAVQAQAENLDGVRKAFGEDIPEVGKIDVSARVKSSESKLEVSKMKMAIAEGQINGRLTLDMASAIPDVDTELTLADLNFNKLLPEKKQQATTKKKTETQKKTGKVFPDEPLPFELLSNYSVKAKLRATNLLGTRDRRLKEAEAKLTIASGKLTASLLKLSSVKGELTSDFVVDASRKGAPAVYLKLKAPEIDLGELLRTEDGVTAIEGPLAVDIALQGNGRSVAQILGSLNGHVDLLMQEGRADAKALDVFVGGLSAMFGTIFVEGANKTKIECAICDLKFEKGIMTPQLAVLDTQYSTVFAEGKVDLKQEQLDLKVSPNAKGVTLSVAFPVLVKGALSQPNVDVEKTGALLKATELWATVVYPPAALVKFSDLGDGKENPCVSLVAEKAGIPIVEDVGKAVKGVGNKIKDVGSGLGKLLGGDKQDEASPASEDEPGEAEPEDADENLFEDY